MRSGVITWMVASVTLAAACVEQEPSAPTAEDRKTIEQHILKQEPKPKFAVNADLEGKVVYLGVDVDQDVIKPGVPFKLTHYWKVKGPVSGWRLFVHISDPARKRFINADHKPIQGRYPVTFWKAGEIVRDEHTVTLPPNWGEDKVQIYTGLWQGKLRMKPKGPQDAENRIIAATLPVQVKKVTPPAPRKVLVAAKTAKPVTIDGKLNDPVWQVAAAASAFVHPGNGGPVPLKTTLKAAWDDKHLYLAFENQDEDVWSDLKKRDDKLWTQEAVEVFIDADGDGKDYIELQVNPHGAIFDSYLPERRKNQDDWNSKLRVKVAVDGTLTKRDDKDKGWTVEMAIPLADVKGRGTGELKLPPAVGTRWRVNFFRMDKPATGPQLAAAWSPPMTGDFHEIGRFGELLFGDAEGKALAVRTAVVPPPPPIAAKGPPPAPPTGKVLRIANPLRGGMRDPRMRRPPIRPRPPGPRPAPAPAPAPAKKP